MPEVAAKINLSIVRALLILAVLHVATADPEANSGALHPRKNICWGEAKPGEKCDPACKYAVKSGNDSRCDLISSFD